jgi:hypothetical protein
MDEIILNITINRKEYLLNSLKNYVSFYYEMKLYLFFMLIQCKILFRIALTNFLNFEVFWIVII